MRAQLAGGSYGFALPDRTFGALMPDHVMTSDGRVELPGEAVLGLVGTRYNGQLFMSGQGHSSGFAWVWDGTWKHLVQTALAKGETFGVSPCAFGDRALFVATSGHSYLRLDLETGQRTEHLMDVGTQGFRYVDGDTPVTGDATLRDGELFEYTRRGDVTIGQGHYGGCLANGRVLEPDDRRFVRFEREHDDLAVAMWDQLGHSAVFHWLTRAEVDTLQEPATAEPIVRIGRPCGLAFFEFGAGPASPGNWTLAVRNISGPASRPAIVTDESVGHVTGQVFGHFVGGTLVDAIESRAAEAARAGRIPFLYWDSRNWPRWPNAAPSGSVLCLQAYCRKDEDPLDFEAEIRGIVGLVPSRFPVALVCQCYTSNLDMTSNLKAIVPVFARVARDNPNVLALLVFTGNGRATGLPDHPEVRPLWEQLAAGIPSAPLMTVPSVPAPDPQPKPPAPKPQPAPKPATLFPGAARFSGGKMDVYARLNGNYIGVDPSAPDKLYSDRTKGDGWERIKLTPHENGRFDALLVAANKQISFGPGGLELRPGGAIGEWELPFCTTQPDGSNLAYRFENGVLAGPVLVLEAA